MLERYDQTELLGLIEGDLDSPAAAALQSRLAKDPAVASMIEAMIRDRAALRSMEEPALPHDFLMDIESMLCRPMLYEPAAEVVMAKPGEFRRQQLRQGRRMRWGRIAAAAALLLATTAGAWTLVRLINNPWSESTGELHAGNMSSDDVANAQAMNAPARATNTTDVRSPDALAAISRDELGPGTVHHHRPPRRLAGDSTPVLAAAEPNDAAAVDATNLSGAGEPTIVAVDFAVVILSPSAGTAESAVSGAIADLGERAALVRNFSYVEAQKLAEEFRVAHGGLPRNGSAREPALAMAPGVSETAERTITRREMHDLAQSVREQWRTNGERDSAGSSGPGTQAGNATLAGAAALAPTLEQQLDFSSRGATYTLAVPASQMIAFIERLALGDATTGGATMLRMLPSRAVESASGTESTRASSSSTSTLSQPTLEWLTEGPLVRQAMQRLAQARGDTIILVPVMVK